MIVFTFFTNLPSLNRIKRHSHLHAHRTLSFTGHILSDLAALFRLLPFGEELAFGFDPVLAFIPGESVGVPLF